MKKTFFTLLFVGIASLLSATEPYFRATWISTVANIDFPTKAAIGNYAQQKQDMINMLDAFQEMHLNAIVFQVRPTADALYQSDLEPWSAWLTGKQGEAATYDPLEFVCTEAHKRGIDVHVWINPYRVTGGGSKIEDIAPNHVFHKHPEWFVKYGTQWYFAPHLQETRDFLCSRPKRDRSLVTMQFTFPASTSSIMRWKLGRSKFVPLHPSSTYSPTT